jgi:hypothetical protein
MTDTSSRFREDSRRVLCAFTWRKCSNLRWFCYQKCETDNDNNPPIHRWDRCVVKSQSVKRTAELKSLEITSFSRRFTDSGSPDVHPALKRWAISIQSASRTWK